MRIAGTYPVKIKDTKKIQQEPTITTKVAINVTKTKITLNI